MLDLRLLHYYQTSVCATFPLTNDQQIFNFWSASVPKMSFNNEPLLDAVLSATALHMSAQLPDDEQLSKTRHTYYGRAVTKHREALSTIDRSTADPLCIASVFIMLTTFNLSRQTSVSAPCSPPFRWFRIIHGMGCLMRHAEPFFESDGVRILVQESYAPLERNRYAEELPHLPDLDNLLLLDNDALDHDLDDCYKKSRHNFWRRVISILSIAIGGASKHSIRHELLRIAAETDEHFLRLVEEEDTITIIVLSHYFALLKWTGENWWLQSEFNTELLRLFSSIPQDFQWALAMQASTIGESENFSP